MTQKIPTETSPLEANTEQVGDIIELAERFVTSPLLSVLDSEGLTWQKCPACWAYAPLGEDLPHTAGCPHKNA